MLPAPARTPSQPLRECREPFVAYWRRVWLALCVIAIAAAAPLANEELLEARHDVDTQLIVAQRLWESDPAYVGTPQNWTRFAAWLLDSEQLIERVRELHPSNADDIEAEYRRDMLFACAGVIGVHLAMWGLPLAAAYLAGMLMETSRRRRSG